LRLADVYDALMSRRTYKEAYSHEQTLEIMATGRGVEFDPDIYDCFREIVSAFKAVWEQFNEAELNSEGEDLFRI
jgi:putative two-component system response regulator